MYRTKNFFFFLLKFDIQGWTVKHDTSLNIFFFSFSIYWRQANHTSFIYNTKQSCMMKKKYMIVYWVRVPVHQHDCRTKKKIKFYSFSLSPSLSLLLFLICFAVYTGGFLCRKIIYKQLVFIMDSMIKHRQEISCGFVLIYQKRQWNA